MSRLGENFSDDKTMVVTVPGRKNGAARSTPVDPMTVDDSLCAESDA
jgi:hypothetical protein